MHSKTIESFLRSKKIKVGDFIRVDKSGRAYEGILMPQTGSGDSESIVVKLDSGYNIGVRFENARISRVTRKEKTTRWEKEKLSFDPRKPAVSIISTGGTITSRVDYKTGGATALTRPADILKNVPELADIANIKNILKPFTIMSESMNHTHWQSLAKTCARELNKKEIKGVLVTHGTDVLHFTAAALSFFLKNLGKPVVLLGSQRSSDRGSSDAGMNLVCSAHTAISDMAEVGICMHGSIADDYCIFSRGTRVRKMHTSRRDAFRPVNEPPIAKVWPDGKVEVTNNHRKRDEKKKIELDAKFEPNIAMLLTYPGSDPSVMSYLIKKGCKGFVIQATGLGQVPAKTNSWLPAIKSAVDSGIPVFLAAKTIYGRLNCNVYSEGRAVVAAGAVPLEDMLAETAYVKLGWVLGHTKDMKKAKEMMLTNHSDEISSRSGEEGIGI